MTLVRLETHIVALVAMAMPSLLPAAVAAQDFDALIGSIEGQ